MCIHVLVCVCIYRPTNPTDINTDHIKSTEAFVLTLPGISLDVSLLVNKKKKFRTRGGREGDIQATKALEEDGMGKLVPKKTKGSVKV